MLKTKVLFAYCHELGRALSINGARAEFFPESRMKEIGSLFPVAIATVMSHLVALTITLKLKTVKNLRLRTSVHPIHTSSDVNGLSSLQMPVRRDDLTNQQLILRKEKPSKN